MASKNPKICIIGAGFSGMTAAIQLKKQLGTENFVIYEENPDFGGTWLVNTYPGCRCDVRSHLYSLSFELNPNWTENYSTQKEIWTYMKGIADRHNLYQYAKFNHQVTYLNWDDEAHHWKVTVFDKIRKESTEEVYDFIISGIGGLRVPLLPEEFNAFKGPKMHSAQWDDKINLQNKRVGVIGNGASAIQIIPEIASEVSQLFSYQRKPSWLMPQFPYTYPQWLKTLFTHIPILMLLLRLFIFLFHETLHFAFKSGSAVNALAQKLSYFYLKRQTRGSIELRRQMTPNFKFGCKRVMVSSEYYKTFKRPNVHLIRSGIEKVDANSITTSDGKRIQLDVLILATGFRIQEFCFPLKIKGKNGIDMMDAWKDGTPTTYYGIMTNKAPNAFLLLGPNSALGHNSVLFQIECQVNFTIQVIRECLERGAKSVNVNPYAEEEWMDSLEKAMKGTIWGSESCGSWYANKDGKVTTLWPKNCTSYFRETRKVNMNHMDFTY